MKTNLRHAFYRPAHVCLQSAACVTLCALSSAYLLAETTDTVITETDTVESLTLSAGNSLSIQGTDDNAITYTINGSLTASGTTTSNVSINVAANQSLKAGGSGEKITLTYVDLDNYGTIDFTCTATSTPSNNANYSISMTGSITNYAGATMTFTELLCDLSATGAPNTITNSGTMNIGTLFVKGSGGDKNQTTNIINADNGTLTISEAYLNNYGSISNTGSGDINITSKITLSTSTSITNSGSGDITIGTLNATYSSQVSNSGSGTIDITTSSIASNNSNTHTNSGDGTINFGATDISNGAKVANTNSGTISFSSLTMTANANSSVTNSGTGNLNITDATLSLGTITNGAEGTLNITGTVTISSSVFALDNSGALVINGGTLDATDLTLSLGGTVTLSNNASIIADTLTLTLVSSTEASSAIAMYDAGSVDGSITADTLTINTNAESITNADGSITYTVSSLAGLSINASDSFTLNVNLTDAQQADYTTALESGTSVNIVFSGLDTSTSEDTTLNALNFGDNEIDLSGMSTDNAGNIIINNVIPEPSTATLSLLALAALMARRKRAA